MSAPEPFLDERESLACVHCGLCLSACPTFLETGDENDSPRGRIYLMRALQEGRLPLEAAPVRHLDRCLGCRACEVACPSGVPYGNLLEHTRAHIEQHYRRPWFQRWLRRVAIEQVLPYPRRMRAALLPASLLRRIGIEPWLPRFLREVLALIPRDSTPDTLPERLPAEGPRRGRVGLVRGCVMSVLFARTNANTARLLNAAGYDVFAPPDQGCCGALFAHGGNLEAARESARRMIERFESEPIEAVIINAAGCGSTLKEYGRLLEGDPEWASRARAFSGRVKDLSEFLPATTAAPRAGGEIAPRGMGFGTVTFHDACHLAHAQRITGAPRALVQSVSGVRYVELAEADVCCGSAGTYNPTEPGLARQLQGRKTANILASGADTVVTTNPGCILQIRAGLQAAGASRVRVMHLADYLVETGSAAALVPTEALSMAGNPDGSRAGLASSSLSSPPVRASSIENERGTRTK